MPYCNNCGNEANKTDKFCSKCGFKLFSEQQNETPGEELQTDQEHQRGYFDDIFDNYMESVKNYAQEEWELKIYSIWGKSAILLANELDGLLNISKITDLISLEKCGNIINLCAQPMVSKFYHDWNLQEKHTAEENVMARRAAFQNIKTFLNVPSDDSIHIHLCLDCQLNQYLNEEVPLPLYYLDVFNQRLTECCTGERIVNWDKVPFPFSFSYEFREQCEEGKYRNLDTILELAMNSSIINAWIYMVQEFKK